MMALRQKETVENTRKEYPVAELLNGIIQNSPDVIAITDQTGMIIFINQQCESLFGYQPNELIGENITRLVPKLFIHHEDGNINSTQKYPILKAFSRSGAEIQASVSLSTFQVASGNEPLYQVAIRDAKKRQEIEQDFLAQNTAMNAVANGIIITDPTGIIQWVNPAFSRMTGYSSAELVGQHERILRSDKHPQSYYQQIWDTILAGETWHGNVLRRRKDGSLYHEEQSISPVFNQQGEIIRFIAIHQDVTQRYKAEQELKQAHKEIRGQLAEITRLAKLLRENNQELDKEVQERSQELAISHIALAEANRQLMGLNELKSSFLGMITHELRTPLVSTLFTMQIIERGYYQSMPPEQKELFQQLQNSLNASKAMIDNLVRYAEFIGKQGVIKQNEVDINEIAGQILSILHKKMDEKSLMLTGSIASDIPPFQGDEERIADVFNELLENAIKFTPEGGNIHVRIWADLENLYVSIEDTGTGIAEEDLPALWEGFSQVADPFKRGHLGLGLGLALVKHIVEAHQGEVWVHSELGVGSTFGFSLPIIQ